LFKILGKALGGEKKKGESSDVNKPDVADNKAKSDSNAEEEV
jgi:hypothetical protein